MTELTIDRLGKRFGAQHAVDDLSLRIPSGAFLVLLGPSGCGKSTTLRMLAGLEDPTSGTIAFGDRVIADGGTGHSTAPSKRGIGMVFQSYALWPHMTVQQNVEWPLTVAGWKRRDRATRVQEVLESLEIAHLAGRTPALISGGQQQRVAIARTIAPRPDVVLFDEPLSNLDARLRTRLRADLRELQQSLGLTSVYVTHDQEEALALADRIAMMQFGRIVQIGTPHEIYAKPRSASIADFLGVGNVLPVEPLDGAHVRIAGSDIALQVPEYAPADELRACIRAEDIEYIDEESGANCIRGRVATREFLGATAVYRVQVAPDVQLEVAGSKRHLPPQTEGEEILLRLDVEAIQVLPADVDDIPRSDVPTTSVGQVGV